MQSLQRKSFHTPLSISIHADINAEQRRMLTHENKKNIDIAIDFVFLCCCFVCWRVWSEESKSESEICDFKKIL